nr:insulinase family protein [Paludibacteraceae bacterium]
SIDACIRGSLEDGAFYVIGVPNDGFTRDEVENAIWDELEMLKKESVEKLELEKVVNKYEATQILSDLSEAAKAERLGYYEMIDAPDLVNMDFDNYAKVTPAELRDTATKIFRHENCCLLWYMKNDSDRG